MSFVSGGMVTTMALLFVRVVYRGRLGAMRVNGTAAGYLWERRMENDGSLDSYNSTSQSSDT